MKYPRLVQKLSLVSCVVCFASAIQAQPDLRQFREHMEARQNRGYDRPDLNPHPEKVLVLKGRKDSRIEIWFDLLYTTTNDACSSQALIGRIAGAPNVPQAVHDSVRVPAGVTGFSANFFLDRYLPGVCGWQSMALGESAFNPSVASHPINHGIVVVTRPKGGKALQRALACHPASLDASHAEKNRLECGWKGFFSEEGTTLSLDGGVVEVEITLSPDSDTP